MIPGQEMKYVFHNEYLSSRNALRIVLSGVKSLPSGSETNAWYLMLNKQLLPFFYGPEITDTKL